GKESGMVVTSSHASDTRARGGQLTAVHPPRWRAGPGRARGLPSVSPYCIDGPRREMTRAAWEKCGHDHDCPPRRLQVPASRFHSVAWRTRINGEVLRGKAAAPRSDTGRMLLQLQATVYSIAAPPCRGSISFEPRPSTLPALGAFIPSCSLPRLW